MRRLKEKFEGWWDRSQMESSDEASSWDKSGAEIKGVIYALTTIFAFISLTSYSPLDTLLMESKQYLQIMNLGGLMGAWLAQAVLGNVGAAGYSLLLITSWLTYAAFARKNVLDILSNLLGIVTATILSAIGSFLMFSTSSSEGSLWLGGSIGIHVGGFFSQYFNTTGALLIVVAGLVVTALLSTEMSLSELFEKVVVKEPEKEKAKVYALPTEPAPRKNRVQPVPAEEEQLEVEIEEETQEEPIKAAKTKAKKKSTKKAAPQNTTLDEQPDDGDASLSAEGPSSEEDVLKQEIIAFKGDYTFPSISLIKTKSSGGKPAGRRELKKNAQALCDRLESFGVTGDILSAEEGPVLTTYELKPSSGIKLKAIANLTDDLGLAMGTDKLRIEAPIPGKTVVGIEVPREKPQTISLKEMLSHSNFNSKDLKIPAPIGKNTRGEPIFFDLAAMPHALVAGTTGSGKSVFINSVITSLLFKKSPKELRLILVDPKMLEFAIFQGLPHLLTDVITENQKALKALAWCVEEMERRYALMAKTGSKNIESYNSKMKGSLKKMPYIVLIIDELADLMMTAGKEAEIHITRIAQKARAAGIHMILATQRPSTNVVTGLIKANIPTRISFKVPSGVDSRTILNAQGAENLIGKGDMLMAQTGGSPVRYHGSFVTEEDLKRITDKIKGRKSFADYYLDF